MSRNLWSPGSVRFIGQTAFKHGLWVGVQLDNPLGRNDGSIGSQRYFKCVHGFGIFVRADKIKLLRERPRSVWQEWGTRAQGAALRGRAALDEEEARSLSSPTVSSSGLGVPSDVSEAGLQSSEHGAGGAKAGAGADQPEVTGPRADVDDPQREHTNEPGQTQSTQAGLDEFVAQAVEDNPYGRMARVVTFGSGASAQGKLCESFGTLQRASAPTSNPGQGLLQKLFGSMSSGLQYLINGGNQAIQIQTSELVERSDRPRLGDVVRVVDANDERHDQIATIGRDDRDAQPYRLVFEGNVVPNIFYHEAAVTLVQRGERPHRGDSVIVVRSGDSHEGERAVVVQDDHDAQPFRYDT